MEQKYVEIATAIIGGVETGGQRYDIRRYDAYVPPYHNTKTEHTCTLGWAGNYGSRAKRLCQMVLDADPEAFKRADTANIKGRLTQDWERIRWNPSSKEKTALVAIITTDAGKKAQDQLFAEQLAAYEKNAIAYGVSKDDIQSIIMWCEIEHLGGLGPVKRIFGRAVKPWTPDTIYASLLKDQQDKSSSNQVGDKIFQSRHECCVRWIKQYITVTTKKEEKAVSIIVGSARIDERGKASGGAAGDQTGKEVSTQAYYKHSKGWYVLRPKSATVAAKMAYAMQAACNNNNIGYDQSNNQALYRDAKAVGFDPAKVRVKTETDCARLVRVCALYAGVNAPDFYTGNERAALIGTGAFEDVTSQINLYTGAGLCTGDVLVTKTKGHTVIVVQGSSRTSSKTFRTVSVGTGKKGLQVTTYLNKRKTPVAGVVQGAAKKGSYIYPTERSVGGQFDQYWFKSGSVWLSGKYLTGWVQDKPSGKWWYITSGSYVKNSWKKIDGIWYYFGADGYMVANCYVKYRDHYCWVNGSGAWIPVWDTKEPDKKYKVIK